MLSRPSQECLTRHGLSVLAVVHTSVLEKNFLLMTGLEGLQAGLRAKPC